MAVDARDAQLLAPLASQMLRKLDIGTTTTLCTAVLRSEEEGHLDDGDGAYSFSDFDTKFTRELVDGGLFLCVERSWAGLWLVGCLMGRWTHLTGSWGALLPRLSRSLLRLLLGFVRSLAGNGAGRDKIRYFALLGL